MPKPPKNSTTKESPGASDGLPLQFRNLGLRISILEGSTPVYVETNNISSNGFSLYKLAIGDGTPITGSMVAFDWASGNKHIKVEIDPYGGTNYTTLGTNELLSVPYTLYAASSGSTGGGAPSGPAGGDLTGTYPDPQIAGDAVTSEHILDGEVKTDDLDFSAVTNTIIANNAVSTTKIADGAVTSTKLDAMGATNGQVLTFDGTNWAPDNITGGSGDNWGSQTVETDATLSDDGTTGNELSLAQNGANDGQILTWDDANSIWSPTDLTATGDAFFEADATQIAYTDAADMGKDFLVNTQTIDYTDPNGDPEYKMLLLPSKDGAFRAGKIDDTNWT